MSEQNKIRVENLVNSTKGTEGGFFTVLHLNSRIFNPLFNFART